MKIIIEYCKVCNYLPIASKLGLDIKQEFGFEVDYVPAGMGAFEVRVGEEIIYSKLESDNRFPKKGAVIETLKQKFAK